MAVEIIKEGEPPMVKRFAMFAVASLVLIAEMLNTLRFAVVRVFWVKILYLLPLLQKENNSHRR